MDKKIGDDDMNTKIQWLRNALSGLDMQGMIVSNPINIRYLTGIQAEGTLLITRRENIYITDGRYIEAVNTILTIDDEIIVYDIRDISKEDYENFFLFCENVGFEENYVTYAKYKEYMHLYKINNLAETENLIENQRMVKDLDEIVTIQKACEITDQCFEYLKEYIKIGLTEKEIALEIDKYFKLHGADGLAFDTIVASGTNSSMPHAVPTDRRIVSGDVITIDFGCTYQGYCSDMTRTVFVDTVPEEIKPVYDLVLKNQKAALEELKEGAIPKNISKIVENDFKLRGYSLIHSLGHSLGLEIHEKPYINRTNEIPLKAGNVVTDEPGIYLPGKFGVRIEDTVLISKTGCKLLTKSDKNYVIIKGK